MSTRQPTSPQRRREELERPGALAALHAERLAAVVRWRSYRAGSHLHRPEPLAAELNDDPAVRWLVDDEPAAERDVHVGFDRDGRIAIAHEGAQPRVEQAQLFSWLEGGDGAAAEGAGGESGAGLEEIVEPFRLSRRTAVSVAHLRRDEAGRVIARDDDQDGSARYRYDAAGRVAEIEERTVYEEPDEPVGVSIRRCEYGADGALVAVRQDEALVWEADRHAHEPDLPTLEELRWHLTMPLARPLALAIETAADTLDDPRFAVLQAAWPLPLPPRVVVAGGAWVERMRGEGEAVVESVFTGLFESAAGLVEADVFAQLDGDTRRLMRQYAQRVTWDRDSDARTGDTRAWAEAAVEELAMLLGPGGASSLPVALRAAGTADLPDAALAPGGPGATGGAAGEAGEHARGADAQALGATGRGCDGDGPHGAGAASGAGAGDGSRTARAVAATLPLTRDGLRDAARDVGLPAAAAAAFADDARLAIALVPDPDGASQLGGVPPLPAGTPWPCTADGRPLTPLAAIDCAALPGVEQVPERTLLPADGTLLLFADLFAGEPLEETLAYLGRPEAAGGFVAVLHVSPGTAVAPPEPPQELRRRRRHDGIGLLPQTPVAARPCASLRESWAAADLLGIDGPDRDAYERLHEAAGADAGAAQLLGHVRSLHDDPREEGEALLLSLHDGATPGFDFLDAGALHLLAAAEELRAGRWERVEAVAESG